jgi:DNA-binding GntR family transcriptional regulator
VAADASPSVTPIRRRTAGQLVADEIRRRIWTGDLESGERLNQEDLAAALGVSRLPVREALLMLEREGVVQMAPHKGAFVERLDEPAVRDHYELFGHLDGFALRLAIGRLSPTDRAALATAMTDCADIADPDRMQQRVQEIRALIHEAGGSPRFRAVARGLAPIVAGNFFREVPGALAVSRSEMPRVGAAVAEGDVDGAVAAYGAMMRSHGDLVVAILRSR